MKKILCVLITLFFSSQVFSKDLVKVKAYEKTQGGEQTVRIEITSVSDEITIRKMDVNRGKCHPYGETFPMKLGFSQKLVVVVMDCQLLEIKLDTDKGGLTFNF